MQRRGEELKSRAKKYVAINELVDEALADLVIINKGETILAIPYDTINGELMIIFFGKEYEREMPISMQQFKEWFKEDTA